MDFKNFIGIDISKGTFDYALIKDEDSSSPITGATANSPSGLAAFEEFLHKQGLNMSQTLICMEQTGIYCRLLSHYLAENHYHVWLEMPVQIIRSQA